MEKSTAPCAFKGCDTYDKIKALLDSTAKINTSIFFNVQIKRIRLRLKAFKTDGHQADFRALNETKLTLVTVMIGFKH